MAHLNADESCIHAKAKKRTQAGTILHDAISHFETAIGGYRCPVRHDVRNVWRVGGLSGRVAWG